jgi:hypothetical protein
MAHVTKLRAGILLLGLCGIFTSATSADDAAAKIKAEVARLQQASKEHPVTDPDFAPLASIAQDSLRGALEELNAGRMYLSLEKLSLGSDYLAAARAGADKEKVVKGGLPAFEEKWGKANLVLTKLDEEAATRDWSHSPAAVRALSEAAQGRTIALLEGGRGFAPATAPKDGLAYLGQAEGEAGFAKFCASLDVPNSKPPVKLRSMLPELVALQQKTNAAFQPPRSIDLHSRFIALNSALKLGEELDARKFYAGALYQYLEAVRHYGMLDMPAVDAAKPPALKSTIADEQKKLDASSSDPSIAQLFLERAASQITHVNGSSPTADEWRSAQVIVEQVLPAYFATEKAPAATSSHSGQTVTITLVRWPYT